MTRCGMVLMALALMVGCNKQEPPKAEASAPKETEAKGRKDEVVISPQQQSAAMIRTDRIRWLSVSEMKRVPEESTARPRNGARRDAFALSPPSPVKS